MHSDTVLLWMLIWENLHELLSIFTRGKNVMDIVMDMPETQQQSFVDLWLILNST